MRVWLAAFVLLFAAIELFEWITQLGSWQPTGVWLILGGMGLAALSNANHLPKLDSTADSTSEQSNEKTAKKKAEAQNATSANEPVALRSAAQGEKIAPQAADESDKDSISFKVRPLKR